MHMNKPYSEEDIQKVIVYLRTNRKDLPDTREQAIKILDQAQSASESIVETLTKMAKKARNN